MKRRDFLKITAASAFTVAACAAGNHGYGLAALPCSWND